MRWKKCVEKRDLYKDDRLSYLIKINNKRNNKYLTLIYKMIKRIVFMPLIYEHPCCVARYSIGHTK